MIPRTLAAIGSLLLASLSTSVVAIDMGDVMDNLDFDNMDFDNMEPEYDPEQMEEMQEKQEELNDFINSMGENEMTDILFGKSEDLAHSNERLDVATCREKGFDPMRLACNTCKLLPQKHQDLCRACCQSYLDASHRRTKPFRSALLVQAESELAKAAQGAKGQEGGPPKPKTGIEELSADLEEWDALLQEKGGRTSLQVLHRTVLMDNARSRKSDMFTLLMRGRPHLEALFFDEPLPNTKKLDYNKLKPKAVESVSLDGLSKDDIKDMLMTLL